MGLSRRGYARHRGVTDKAADKALDCRVYARAAASIYGLDRFSESHWRQMEKALGFGKEPPGIERVVPKDGAERQEGRVKPRFLQRKVVRSDDPYL